METSGMTPCNHTITASAALESLPVCITASWDDCALLPCRHQLAPSFTQGHSRPVSPSSIPLRANSMALAAPMTGMHGNRNSLDLGRGLSSMRTATLPVPAPVAATGPPPPSAAATGAGQHTFDDAEILQQLMAEITRLKKELSKEV